MPFAMCCACMWCRTKNPLCHIHMPACMCCIIKIIFDALTPRTLFICRCGYYTLWSLVNVQWYGFVSIQWNRRVWIVTCSVCHKFTDENYWTLFVPCSLWAASCYLSDLHFAGVWKQNREYDGKRYNARTHAECGRIDVYRILKKFIYYVYKLYWLGSYFMRSLKDLSVCRTVWNVIFIAAEYRWFHSVFCRTTIKEIQSVNKNVFVFYIKTTWTVHNARSQWNKHWIISN